MSGGFAVAGAVVAALLMTVPVAGAADFEQPLNLAKGSRIDLTIERTGREGAGRSTTLSFRYRQTINPMKGGYEVRQVLTGKTLPDGLSAEDVAGVEQGLAAASDVRFATDATLKPIRMVEWEALVDRISSAAAASSGDPSAKEAARAGLMRRTAETAAPILLAEQAMLAIPQNVTLSLGEPLSVTTKVASPTGGEAIDRVETIQLESIDRARGLAVIVYHRALDPQSASRSVQLEVQRAAALMPEAQRPSAADLAALKPEGTLDCRYEMNLATGLVAKADCHSTATFIQRTLRSRQREDHFVMTQVLVGPEAPAQHP